MREAASGSARVPRADDGVPAIAKFLLRRFRAIKSLLRRDAATSTRDARATRIPSLPLSLYSVRNATIGLMRVARRAGSQVASRAESASTSGASVKASGSKAPTS